MKKIIFGLTIIGLFASCQQDNTTPTPTPTPTQTPKPTPTPTLNFVSGNYTKVSQNLISNNPSTSYLSSHYYYTSLDGTNFYFDTGNYPLVYLNGTKNGIIITFPTLNYNFNPANGHNNRISNATLTLLSNGNIKYNYRCQSIVTSSGLIEADVLWDVEYTHTP